MTARSALNLWIYGNWPTYLDGFTGEGFSRLREGMPQVWRRIKKKFPRRIGFPVGFMTYQFSFLDEREVEGVQRIKNLHEAGGSSAGPHDFPTFTWDAVATFHPYLRNDDPHVRHFDVREEKDLRRGAYQVTNAQVEYPRQGGADREFFYPKKPRWWPQDEVPYGLPALLPRRQDHVGSIMLTAGPDHVVFDMMAAL